MKRPTPHRGYVALFSVLVLTVLLTLAGATAGLSGFLARMNATDAENRLVAMHRARSCAAAAFLLAAQDPTYEASNAIIWLTVEENCRIDSAQSQGNEVQVRASGSHGVSTAAVEAAAVITASGLSITLWDEI